MPKLTKQQQAVVIILLALCLRMVLLAVATDNVDVQNYARVASIVEQHGAAALYAETPGIYPYPPVWMIVEVLAAQVADMLKGSYSLLVRLPIVFADLLIIALLAAWQARERNTRWLSAAFLYAINPVALIVTCLHGQFDAIPIALLLLALFLLAFNYRTAYGGIALAFAIAVKSFPVLFLPIMVAYIRGWRERVWLAGLALAPVALLLLPYLILSPTELVRELFGYRGAALLGFMVPIRTLYVPLMGTSFPADSTMQLLRFSAYVFVAAYLAYLAGMWGRQPLLLIDTVAIFALFYTLYAGIAPQYTLWILPFLLLRHMRLAILYTVSATFALVGFYLYAVPDTLPLAAGVPHMLTQVLYALGGTAWWLTAALIHAVCIRDSARVRARRPVALHVPLRAVATRARSAGQH